METEPLALGLSPVGRGGVNAPHNRFEQVRLEVDWEQLAADDEYLTEPRKLRTEFYDDQTRSLIVENNSPDIPFRYSINAYRGCEHGCAYCYARPGHEYLGMNAGLDFESRIMVKRDAPRLLRDELNRPKWTGELIVMSGVTDCYQPAERVFRLTRGCLEVMLEAGQCTGLITKNVLVTRDIDLLAQLASRNLTRVYISVTTLDAELARCLEPRTATPLARLRAIRELSAAGVPVGVMVAPIIPGLNDQEIPAILAAVREAGARWAGTQLLRLPLAVEPIFVDWLRRERPLAVDRVLALIRETRDGELNSSEFVTRMRGTGLYAEQIRRTFKVFAKRHQLDRPLPALDTTQFRPPTPVNGQLRLF